jgi:hypothetical protein
MADTRTMPRGHSTGAPPNRDLVHVNATLVTLRRDLRSHADASRVRPSELAAVEKALTDAIATIGSVIAGRPGEPAAPLEYDDRD